MNKCIQYTFHRRALIVAEYLVMIINNYELGLLNQLDYSWVCVYKWQIPSVWGIGRIL